MELLREIALILGYIWLAIVGLTVLYLMLPALIDPSVRQGQGGAEHIGPPLFMGFLLALPGLLLIQIGKGKS